MKDAELAKYLVMFVERHKEARLAQSLLYDVEKLIMKTAGPGYYVVNGSLICIKEDDGGIELIQDVTQLPDVKEPPLFPDAWNPLDPFNTGG